MPEAFSETGYFPGADWARVAPERVGLSTDRLAEAVGFAVANESDWPPTMFLPNGQFIATAYVDDKPPYDQVLGPVRPRGSSNGLIFRHGRIVAEWGDTTRADMTFSAAKSYLGVLAGLAVADGLIGSVDDLVAETVVDAGFDSPHNRQITWRHLLQQTSEWQGTLWDRPDSVDHNRQAGVAHDNRKKGTLRVLEQPGGRWEYNDVRVNVLALALLHRFRRALPDVLRTRIMDPIGASRDWEWRGYRNSVVEIDGRAIESVAGGGHWGGGMFISSFDHARLALLVQRRGRWNDREVLPEAWIAQMTTPSAANPAYGFLWWLNTGRQLFPSASPGSVFALGGGQHVLWIDDTHDLLMVARWVDRRSCDGVIAKVLASIV
jgi:hypothetical protein